MLAPDVFTISCDGIRAFLPETYAVNTSFESFSKAREEALKKEGIGKIFCLVFKGNEGGNAFWEKQGYTLRTNLNYRNKSLDSQIPAGE